MKKNNLNYYKMKKILVCIISVLVIAITGCGESKEEKMLALEKEYSALKTEKQLDSIKNWAYANRHNVPVIISTSGVDTEYKAGVVNFYPAGNVTPAGHITTSFYVIEIYGCKFLSWVNAQGLQLQPLGKTTKQEK